MSQEQVSDSGRDSVLGWLPRSEQYVEFDSTVLFSDSYNFFWLESLSETAVKDGIGFIVWPETRATGKTEWFLYSTHEGTFWTSPFDTEAEAKQAAEDFFKSVSTTPTTEAKA